MSEPELADWFSAANARRWELIDKELTGSLSPDESAELDALNAKVDAELERVSPRPEGVLRELERFLSEVVPDLESPTEDANP